MPAKVAPQLALALAQHCRLGTWPFRLKLRACNNKYSNNKYSFVLKPLDVKTIGWLKGKVVQNVDFGSVV